MVNVRGALAAPEKQTVLTAYRLDMMDVPITGWIASHPFE
jgi:hypothetical protein